MQGGNMRLTPEEINKILLPLIVNTAKRRRAVARIAQYSQDQKPMDRPKLRDEFIEWVKAYKDAAECNALAETPRESADYLLSLVDKEIEQAIKQERERIIKHLDLLLKNNTVRSGTGLHKELGKYIQSFNEGK